MAKIKLSLPSGSEVEKNVISYFKSNGGNYLILDAESVASMGLPIILVSKVDNDKVIKIADQNEWSQVKASLKSIISGGQVEYISAPANMSADDVYYTQLTLPVNSFDILKNKFSEANSSIDASVTPVEAVAAPIVNNDSVPNNSSDSALVKPEPAAIDPNVVNPMGTDFDITMPTVPASDISSDGIAASTNIAEEIANMGIVGEENNVVNNSDMIAPVLPSEESAATTDVVTPDLVVPNEVSATNPILGDMVVNNVEESVAEPTSDINSDMIAPVVSEEVPSAPVVSPVIDTPVALDEPVTENVENTSGIDITSYKEKFMKSCEEAFDTLVEMMKNK